MGEIEIGRISALETRTDRLDTDMVEHIREIHGYVKDGFADVDRRFAQVDQRFAQVDRRLDKIDQKFGGLDRKVTELDKKFTGLKGQVTGVERQLTGIREQMADNQRILIARLNVFIDTQGGINRDVESRLPPRTVRVRRSRR